MHMADIHLGTSLPTDKPAIRAMLENGEPQHVESSEEEDVLEALAGFQKRDAGLKAAEPGTGAAGASHNEESDEVHPDADWIGS